MRKKLCPASGSSWQSRETVWHSGVHTVAVEATPRQHGSTAATAWSIVRGAAALAEPLSKNGRPLTFSLDLHSELRQTKPEDPEAVLLWSPGAGWRSLLTPSDARAELLNLYLPICSATSSRPMTIGHLGQSLDGFIATPSGDSQFVTGDDNIVHLHRMRALSDAVVVGAGTVATDDPQLTVRHVPGANPLRVVFDPGRRLSHTYRVFTDDTGPTLYICSRTLSRTGGNAPGLCDHRRSGLRRCERGCGGGTATASRARLLPGVRRRWRRDGVGVPASRSAGSASDRDRAGDHRRWPSGDTAGAARAPQRLPTTTLSRVPDGRRRVVRLRSARRCRTDRRERSRCSASESGHLARKTFSSYRIHPFARHV